MKSRQKPAAQSIWSPRSQRSILKQLELEAAREKVRNLVTFGEKKIAEGKKTSIRQADTVAGGGSYAINQSLARTLEDITIREREVALYRGREQSLQAEIDALTPTAAQAAERAWHQSDLAGLAVKRFEKDRQAELALVKLRKILEERATLTAKMLEIARMVDFAPSADFDAGRFVALRQSLPDDLLVQSHAWLNGFLGQESEKEPCTIGSRLSVIPETLADSGVFRPGTYANLSKKQAKQLSSDEAPKALPSPQEMQASVMQKMNKAEEADFPVSGFLVR